MTQFLDKNKNFEIYADLRADTYRLLYTHMMILKDIPGFEGLNNEQRYGDFYYILDAPILIESYRNMNSEAVFKNSLKEYFLHTPTERLKKIMEKFESNIQTLETTKDKRYFKGSKDLIESVTSMAGHDGDFSIMFDLYIREESENNKREYAEELVKDYLSVLEATVDLHEEVQEFIDSLEKKKLIKFIRMVD
jgi:hypothetical protein